MNAATYKNMGPYFFQDRGGPLGLFSYGDCDIESLAGPSVYDVKIWVKGGSSCDGKEKVTVIIAKMLEKQQNSRDFREKCL